MRSWNVWPNVAEAAERERRLIDDLAVGLGRREEQPDDGHEEECREHEQDEDCDDAVGVASREHHWTSKSLPRQTISTATSKPNTRRSTEIAAASLKRSSWKAR